jgi:hypothetical protein
MTLFKYVCLASLVAVYAAAPLLEFVSAVFKVIILISTMDMSVFPAVVIASFAIQSFA